MTTIAISAVDQEVNLSPIPRFDDPSLIVAEDPDMKTADQIQKQVRPHSLPIREAP